MKTSRAPDGSRAAPKLGSPKAAKVSIWRAKRRFWSAVSESHAGISAGRGVSFVPFGTTPSAIWPSWPCYRPGPIPISKPAPIPSPLPNKRPAAHD